jgi:starch synthase
VPIVRNTGGLADSIIDFISNPKNATGFKFNDYSYLTLLSTIDLAQSTFMLKNIWHNMMIRGMKQDFSWGKAAQTYIDLYKKAISMIRS